MQTACSQCDALIQLPDELAENTRLFCCRCGHPLYSRSHLGWSEILGFALSGFIFLTIALTHPFLGFSVSGRAQSMALIESSTTLWESGEHVLAFLVLIFIVLAPLLLAGLVVALYMTVFARVSRRLAVFFARVLHELDHWNMVEVFVVGVLVSLTKIAGMASIDVGVGFWAFIGFAVSIWLTLARLDRHRLWSSIHAMDART